MPLSPSSHSSRARQCGYAATTLQPWLTSTIWEEGAPPMNNVMRAIHQLCKSSHIQLMATYLLGADNMVADHLSCLWPHHKWQLSPAMFHHLDQCWGPHTINRTASASNSQLPHFNLWFSEAKSKAVDCLLQDWSKDNNWTTPCPYSAHPQFSQETARNNNSHCPQMARLPLVQPPQTAHSRPACTRPSLSQELQLQIWSHPRAPTQQALEVGSLQDLWLPNPAGWSSAAANLLNNALAASTWKQYASNLLRFKAYCITNNISFPPEQDKAVGAVASFLESAT